MRDHGSVSRDNPTRQQRPGGAVRVSRVVAVVLLLLSALGYCGWLLEFLLATDLPVHSSYIAELGASGRPYSAVFRAIDFGTGAAALAATPFLARLVPVQLSPRLTVMVIALFGVIMLLSGGLSMDCAPAASHVCAHRQAAGAVSAEHVAREVLGAAVVPVFVLGAASAQRWFASGFWRNGLRAALVLTITGGLTMLLLTTVGPAWYVGIVARAQAFVQAATLFFGAVYLLKIARVSPRDVVGSERE